MSTCNGKHTYQYAAASGTYEFIQPTRAGALLHAVLFVLSRFAVCLGVASPPLGDTLPAVAPSHKKRSHYCLYD
jgi:hypothetical protein